MTKRLHIDFEVFSAVSIKDAPMDVYVSDPSTKIILTAWALDEGPVEVWEADKGPSPAALKAALRDPSVEIVAWNTTYERLVLAAKGLDIPLSRWLDPMAMARYAGLPGRLKDCAKIPMIGVPPEAATKSETLLIKKFCMPKGGGKVVEREGGGKVVIPSGEPGPRVMPHEAPEDWKLFVDYCRRDVQTMRYVLNWLEPRFPWPACERQIWILDQQINDRGIPIDVEMAKQGEKLSREIIATANDRLKAITGLENVNSVQQLHPWLAKNGYPFDSLGKEFLETALETAVLTAAGREVIELRLGAAKSSVKKFTAIVKETSPDGRLRQQFKYYGAHTGRWSGRGVQPQNLTRQATDKEALELLLDNA